MSGQVGTFEPQELIKDHFRKMTKAWPQDRAANWARELVQQIEQQELSTILLLAYGKMSESLSDGERHRLGMSRGVVVLNLMAPTKVA